MMRLCCENQISKVVLLIEILEVKTFVTRHNYFKADGISSKSTFRTSMYVVH